jgi:flagellar biosynthesis/type III secretory pathway chaperone
MDRHFQKLVANLEDITKLYRQLLEMVRTEKELLINSEIEKLSESNKAKEALLYKIRFADAARERYAKELAQIIGADVNQPRLLELARKIPGAGGDKLRGLHSTLEMLVRRTSELNQENEQYTQSALNTLNGAINEIKGTLAGKKTYAKEGKMNYGPDKAGNFVRKSV